MSRTEDTLSGAESTAANELQPEHQIVEARRRAARLGYPFANLDTFQEDVSAWQQIPMDSILRYRVVPLREEGESLVIAVGEPGRYRELDELERSLSRPLVIEVAAPFQIEEILARNRTSSFLLDKASEELKLEIVSDDDTETGNDDLEATSETSSPIIKLVHSLLVNGIERRASDIHVETKEEHVLLKYRVDGVLYAAMDPVDRQHHSTIVSRLKVMAELDVAEKRVPQDGRFKLKIDGRPIDFRVSIMPSIYGEDVVVRILDKESISEQFSELRLDVLGFPDDEMKRFRKFIREPYGMVLVTGPTGSGKTTTLYAALSEIATAEQKIVTIEDPVEYRIAHITQVPVNEKKGLTFARGLRSILRHDPDTIMVGEVRDAETAQIAVQAALTGHLVFTTVHANNAFDVIGRFLHMGVEPHNFVSALNCVMAQRLVRSVCEGCRVKTSIDPDELDLSGLDDADRNRDFFVGRGCFQCHGTGFYGRTAVCELLSLNDRLRQLILERRATTELKRAAREEGMSSIRDHALEKVFSGVTTLADINKVTFVD
ncbi:MAG: GspE/PulE family protein [Acidobacteriota bacterium]|nr:MAG: GspE/PulE family protein [Acidobacteriota bacterium]